MRPKSLNIHFGYFCKKMCEPKLAKIAQSGHTAPNCVHSGLSSDGQKSAQKF